MCWSRLLSVGEVIVSSGIGSCASCFSLDSASVKPVSGGVGGGGGSGVPSFIFRFQTTSTFTSSTIFYFILLTFLRRSTGRRFVPLCTHYFISYLWVIVTVQNYLCRTQKKSRGNFFFNSEDLLMNPYHSSKQYQLISFLRKVIGILIQ